MTNQSANRPSKTFQKMNVLITGGAGYIGSHACVEFIQAGHNVVVLDNFCTSSPVALQRVEEIVGRPFPSVTGDIRDRALVEATLRKYAIDAVVHFAGLKAVGESGIDPLEYYNVNVVGSERLFNAMKTVGVHRVIFSSSATVYGDSDKLPFTEDLPLRATNPYGRTKLMIEDILRDLAKSDSRWQIALLRYFNPVGAHPSGRLGEDPRGVPNNLMPFLTQVALGQRGELSIFGSDYDTADGTAVRDYVHVVDLVQGHVKALEALNYHGCEAFNLGTGQGYSVAEMVTQFERVSNRQIKRRMAPRRPGDIAASYASTDLARERLGWLAKMDLYDMCRDQWNWASKNPAGYDEMKNIAEPALPGFDLPVMAIKTETHGRRNRDWN